MRDDRDDSKTAADPRADLVIAILSVNNCPLDKTSDVPIDVCNSILSSGTRDEVSSLLSSVKGVGPKVLNNFFVLRDGS
jgi:hypothetical protein